MELKSKPVRRERVFSYFGKLKKDLGVAMAGALVIPLSSPNGWHTLKFRHIQPNRIAFTQKGLKIDIDRSANPLIYVLRGPVRIRSFQVKLQIQGTLKSTPNNWNGDDYLRVGLVVPGKKHMSTVERWFAADWIKKLFALAPKNMGLDKVYFFDLGNDLSFVGKSRIVPHSRSLIQETVVAVRHPDQKNTIFAYQLPTPLKTYALWLGADGDDTKSQFHLRITSLQLFPVTNP